MEINDGWLRLTPSREQNFALAAPAGARRLGAWLCTRGVLYVTDAKLKRARFSQFRFV